MKFHPKVFEDISSHAKNGQQQWNQRLNEKTVSIKKSIKTNSYNLPGNQNKDVEKDPIIDVCHGDKIKGCFYIQKCISGGTYFIRNIWNIAMFIDQFSVYHSTKSSILKQFDASQRPTLSSEGSGVVIELSAITHEYSFMG